MAELSSLVQRLEVAVSRLESMSGPGGSPGESAGKVPGLVITTLLLLLQASSQVPFCAFLLNN